jgi:hypothetical protein
VVWSAICPGLYGLEGQNWLMLSMLPRKIQFIFTALIGPEPHSKLPHHGFSATTYAVTWSGSFLNYGTTIPLYVHLSPPSLNQLNPFNSNLPYSYAHSQRWLWYPLQNIPLLAPLPQEGLSNWWPILLDSQSQTPEESYRNCCQAPKALRLNY